MRFNIKRHLCARVWFTFVCYLSISWTAWPIQSSEYASKVHATLALLVDGLTAIDAKPGDAASIRARLESAVHQNAERDEAIRQLKNRIDELEAQLQSAKLQLAELEQTPERGDPVLSAAPSPEGPDVASRPTVQLAALQTDAEPPIQAKHGVTVEAINRPVDFAKEIYPLLEVKCFSCHGEKTHRAELRLDGQSTAFKGGIHGPVIIAGKAHESLLFQRTAGLAAGDQMPPVGEKLTGAELGLLKTWIDSGAEWPEHVGTQNAAVVRHWAYIPPHRPDLPDVKHKNWIRNPIDNFVLARLEAEGFEPAPEAETITLIRRLYLDITGLPPTPDEIDAYLMDPNPQKYDALVDRLLSSPHYGERWAVPWLDLARYADSNGYQIDRIRSMWPYRDWVINALNDDMPFDQFTIKQLAGDLLPNPTLNDLIATGFNRNTMINEEGGVDQEEYRVQAVIDRVGTASTVWLGSTLECAQCHNHKFDPFTQKDFYRFYAFFNSTAEEVKKTAPFAAESNGPWVEVPSDEQKAALAVLRPEIERLKALLDHDTPELAADQAEWENDFRTNPILWKILEPRMALSEQRATLIIQSDGSIWADGATPEKDTYYVVADTDLSKLTAIRIEALHDERLPKNGPGRAGHGNFVLSEFNVYAMSPDDIEGVTFPLRNASAGFEAKDYEVAKCLDGNPKTGWAIHQEIGRSHEAVFEIDRDRSFPAGQEIVFKLAQLHGGQHTIGRVRLSVTDAPLPIRANTVPPDIMDAITIEPSERTGEQAEKISTYYRSIAPRLQPVRDKIAQLQALLPKDIPTVLVMRELDEPRATHIFNGGSFLNPGERVYPDVPAFLLPLPDKNQPNRLDLARWLVSRENPLTARVTVNRIWAQYFGTGIVKTSEDFGVQGERPSHPELLDWLAVYLMENGPQKVIKHGWSLKELHRLIVTSAVYRQSSVITPEKLERDPYNRLLSRGPRYRLPAELIRDQALKVSGLLCETIGGPSVFPYQPDGIWRMPYNSEKYKVSEGYDKYRRGLYTHWRRTATYPAFVNFNAPTREKTCTRRPRTNTPLQALTAMNDPAFFECAQSLARRIMSEMPDASDEMKMVYAFRLCLLRAPTSQERQRLLELYNAQFHSYQNDLQAARQTAGIMVENNPQGTGTVKLIAAETNEAPNHIPELAAWTVVSNVLLNLDETLCKE